MRTALDRRILDLIATVIKCCEEPREPAPGHPVTETARVLATLGRFLREGTPWRSLRASKDEASGSTLRRAFTRWARTGLLRKVHALLVAMLRGNLTLILDSCSVRAKRGGELTGPNPTDRGKRGTKYHVAVNSRKPERFAAGTACRSRAWRQRPTSTTPCCSSACSWPPLPSWRASALCWPTKDMMQKATAPYAAASAPNRTSTSAASRAGQATLAGGAQQCLAAGEQAPRPALRPVRLHRSGPTPNSMHTPGCKTSGP